MVLSGIGRVRYRIASRIDKDRQAIEFVKPSNWPRGTHKISFVFYGLFFGTILPGEVVFLSGFVL